MRKRKRLATGDCSVKEANRRLLFFHSMMLKSTSGTQCALSSIPNGIHSSLMRASSKIDLQPSKLGAESDFLDVVLGRLTKLARFCQFRPIYSNTFINVTPLKSGIAGTNVGMFASHIVCSSKARIQMEIGGRFSMYHFVVHLSFESVCSFSVLLVKLTRLQLCASYRPPKPVLGSIAVTEVSLARERGLKEWFTLRNVCARDIPSAATLSSLPKPMDIDTRLGMTLFGTLLQVPSIFFLGLADAQDAYAEITNTSMVSSASSPCLKD